MQMPLTLSQELLVANCQDLQD